MRLDMALTRSNLTCLLAQDGPMTRSEAGNADGFSYLPGRFFAAGARAQGARYRALSGRESVLSLAGRRAGRRRARALRAPLAAAARRTRARERPALREAERRDGGPAAPRARPRRRRARARAACYAARRPSRDYRVRAQVSAP